MHANSVAEATNITAHDSQFDVFVEKNILVWNVHQLWQLLIVPRAI
jgi:hypothetical protein